MKIKVLLLLASLLIVALCANFAVAAEGALKVGIVDLYKALNESEQGKKAKSDLEALIKTKQSAMDEKGKAIEKVKSELEKQGAVLSSEARKAKEEEMERLGREFQRTAADSQNEVRKKEAELTGRILKEIREVIGSIAQEEGYSLVLEKAEGLVLFSAADLDMTEKVIKRFNAAPAKGKK